MSTLSDKKAVIFTAPQGWGKTFHAAKLQQAFECTSVVDEWSPGMPVTPGALHLTNCSAEYVRDSIKLTAAGIFSQPALIDTAWTCSPQTYFGLRA